MHKLGVIVPYRNRKTHLNKFKKDISEYLNKNEIQFELIIVEQIDDKPFNRGKLLNIGFLQAEKLSCDYIVFHDVDMLPIDVDYSYSDIPIHLATNITKSITYFGGVTIFPTNIFKDTNGFPNEYWGWGFEDDELLRRCNISDTLKIRNRKTSTPALEFTKKDSYIKLPNDINYKKNIKFKVTFEVNPVMDENEDYDEWTVFSIPGWDLTLTYNSFARYKFEFWDYKRKCYSIHSDTLPATSTTFDIEIFTEDCTFKVLQDRCIIGEGSYNRLLYYYDKQDYIYLGNANPYRGSNMKEFYGFISEFKIWNNDILIMDYDFKNTTEYYGCRKAHTTNQLYKTIKIPYNRNSKFKLLKHSSNGFLNGKWAHSETRINQIKYIKNLDTSGLNNLKYELIKNKNNHLQVIL
jgi:hypothetical protein